VDKGSPAWTIQHTTTELQHYLTTGCLSLSAASGYAYLTAI